jgi:DNA-binding transcriptional LysR family regulator
MEITRLRQFCAIYQTSNLRKAAELLGISPGSLSKSMRQLQESMKCTLIIPSGRGIVITDKGKQLYVNAQRVISEYQMMQQNMGSEQLEPVPTVRLASFELFTTYFMGSLIHNYFKDHKFFVVERAPGQIETSVLGREVDFGITYAPVPHPELDFLKICSFRKQIFSKRGEFQNLPLSEIPFCAPITLVAGSPTGISNLDGWPNDIPRKVVFQFELLETSLEVCRQGLAAIFCPSFVIPLQNRMLKHEYQLVPLSLPEDMKEVKRVIYIVKRKTQTEGQIIKRVSKAIRLICLS